MRPRIGMETGMDTNSPDGRALLWTGCFIALVVVAGAIAYYVLV